MFQIVLIFHIIVCIVLILIILLQTGVGSQLGAAFGGIGQANQIRTPETFIGKVTNVIAIIFIVTSIFLAVISSNENSIINNAELQQTERSL